ncbi:MAG: phosphoribosylanthranilate isomerase [Sphingobacteriales bacterium]
MEIKICGMKYQSNITEVAMLQPGYMGFICYPQSPRFMANAGFIDVPENIVKTGVFVNESAERIWELIDAYNFDAIQLHGNEVAEFCESFMDDLTVIKAFGIDKGFDFEQLRPFEVSVDYFLFDTKTDKHGGSGLMFDWSLLDNYKMDIPFFLSGGLSLDNLEDVKAIKHPQFYGVDLNSKFEIEPGMKDINKLKKAFEILR